MAHPLQAPAGHEIAISKSSFIARVGPVADRTQAVAAALRERHAGTAHAWPEGSRQRTTSAARAAAVVDTSQGLGPPLNHDADSLA